MSSSTPNFQVFVSHSGKDKVTIAIPLREKLRALGIAALVDEKDIPRGVEADQFMIDVMETADIAVIVLSEEFPARKWCMKECLYFLERRKQARSDGGQYPFIRPFVLPFFYRLPISELYKEPLLGRRDEHGNDIYKDSRFHERQLNNEPEADCAKINNALSSLHNFEGVENYNNATNDSTHLMEERKNDLLNKICKYVQSLVRTTERVSLEAQAVREGFVTHFHPERDTSYLLLDFDATDEGGKPITTEGKVLQAVLDSRSPGNGMISIQGIAGVGKTSILKRLHTLDVVKQRFEDGTFFFTMGMEAKLHSLVQHLSRAVEDTGGKQKSDEMLKKKDWRPVVEIFLSWFTAKQCLFVVDDVWENSDISFGIVQDMLTLHTSGTDSKTVFTTRNAKITREAHHQFQLKPREPLESESRELLTRYAGIQLEVTSDNDNRVINEILEICSGLPLFLAIAGKAIRSYSFAAGSSDVTAYHLYADILREHRWDLLQTPLDSCHRKLVTTLTISVKLLDEQLKNTDWRFVIPLTAAEMYRRLSVLLKNHVCRCLRCSICGS